MASHSLERLRPHFDGPLAADAMEVLLYAATDMNPLVSVLQMTARLFRIHLSVGFQQNYARNNLEALANTVLNFLEQYVLLCSRSSFSRSKTRCR